MFSIAINVYIHNACDLYVHVNVIFENGIWSNAYTCTLITEAGPDFILDLCLSLYSNTCILYVIYNLHVHVGTGNITDCEWMSNKYQFY